MPPVGSPAAAWNEITPVARAEGGIRTNDANIRRLSGKVAGVANAAPLFHSCDGVPSRTAGLFYEIYACSASRARHRSCGVVMLDRSASISRTTR